MENKKNVAVIALSGIFVFGLLLAFVLMPKAEFSNRERRVLSNPPVLSTDSLLSGDFMEDFEYYVYDHFPGRDWFLRLKSAFARRVELQFDDNDFYYREGQISQIIYPANESKIRLNNERLKKVYNDYIAKSDCRVMFSLIPDKNLYIGEKYGVPTIDYDKVLESISKDLDFAEFIDIREDLKADSFYSTDHHWRQEEIVPVANKILLALTGEELEAEYTENKADAKFFGTYYNQSGIEIPGDDIYYLTSYGTEDARVLINDGKNEVPGVVYDMDKVQGRDAYEMYLSGNQPVVTIENEEARFDKELVIFRDSYGSSIAPLFIDTYSKITLIDLRYLNSALIKDYVLFDNQDVLFLYSMVTYNNSISMGM